MPKLPFRNEVARVGDRRVRESLADDRNLDAVHFLQRVRRKHLVTEAVVLMFCATKSILPLKSFSTIFLHALGAVCHLPVRCHDVDAEQLAGVDHVLRIGPQRRRRALPRVAAIEQQRARAARLQTLDQR